MGKAAAMDPKYQADLENLKTLIAGDAAGATAEDAPAQE